MFAGLMWSLSSQQRRLLSGQKHISFSREPGGLQQVPERSLLVAVRNSNMPNSSEHHTMTDAFPVSRHHQLRMKRLECVLQVYLALMQQRQRAVAGAEGGKQNQANSSSSSPSSNRRISGIAMIAYLRRLPLGQEADAQAQGLPTRLLSSSCCSSQPVQGSCEQLILKAGSNRCITVVRNCLGVHSLYTHRPPRETAAAFQAVQPVAR